MRLRDKLAGVRPMGGAARDDGAQAAVLSMAERDEHHRRDEYDAREDRIRRLRSLIGEVAARGARQVPMADHAAPRDASGTRARGSLPVGALRESPDGPLHIVETYLGPEHRHGRVAVKGALSVDAALVGRLALDPQLGDVDFTRAVFLDTETTGLAGGTGTVPFLIGLAYFEDGALKVEQLFLRQLGQERPMLAYLAERLASASCVVSYNGKSFDWPLLRTRAILNRVALPEPRAHLDLLHCARRILKSKLQSVRLCEVERGLLGHEREDDVHGSLIPALYFDYLRDGDSRPLLPVLEHNVSDLVGLAAILPELTSHYAQVRPHDDPTEHLALAKLALRARDFERAEAFGSAAAQGGGPIGLAHEAHRIVATSLRRRGAGGEAVAALCTSLQHAGTALDAALVHHALAKLYEHAIKDLRAAHAHALHTLPVEGALAHGRRLGRLRRKLLLAQ